VENSVEKMRIVRGGGTRFERRREGGRMFARVGKRGRKGSLPWEKSNLAGFCEEKEGP